MKRNSAKNLFVAALLFATATLSCCATILLDDTWADGVRTNQNLPTESAWFSSTGASLAAATNAMTLSLGSSAIMAITYFGVNSATPAQLGIGDTLTATIKFTFTGVAAANTSQGFRLGMCDFSDSMLSPKWVAADGFSSSSQGAGVQGYALFQNMGATFGSASPMDIRKRTTLTDNSLLGTSGDWTSQITGPGNTNTFSGFANSTQYNLQIVLQRTDVNSLAITVTWLNTASGASLATTFTDTNATDFNFDGMALRPQDAAASASTITFNEVKVDLSSASTPPSITSDPQPETVYVGQSAVFTVDTDGSVPLSYQWYFNSDTLLAGATNATFTISNAQTTDAGIYSVVVTNLFGSATSDVASLTVNLPTAPSIVMQPQSQIVLPGESVTFNVEAGGTEPLNYQWYYNTNMLLTNATDSTLTLTNIQPSQAGAYSVVVSNFVSSIISSSATLSVNTNPVAPVFTTEPVSQTILVGGNANFTATVFGTPPITYQWNKDAAPISGANSATFNLTNVQFSGAGSYTLTVSNNVDSVISTAAILTVTPKVPVVNSAYDLIGFGQNTTGGGVLADNDPNYAQVYTATDLANALNSKTVKVIEIMNDLDLGYNEIEATAKAGSEPFRADNPPLLHPVLLVTGVSIIDVQKKNGLTIFSANGSTIRHAHLNVKNSSNIIIRNLKFDELWEWDEATKGDYDKNNWDFITVGDAGQVTNLWVDHCTFTKAYDGIIDIVDGSAGITISWCKYTGDDGYTNRNSWVWQQLDSLESNKTAYAMYDFLRNNGFSETNIFAIIQGHDKTHLIGPNDLDPNNAKHTVTLHHEWFINCGDRLPRLRGGNVHDYNIYADDSQAIVANRMRSAVIAAMTPANAEELDGSSPTYDFNNYLNGSISTEGGAMLVEKSVYIDCLTPLRNNQTDPSDPEYTGKIEALDTIYHMDNADGSVTEIRGNSTDSGNPLGPFQAPVIPFSWNLPNNQLPYSYIPDDPSQLQAIVTDPQYGAGAGVLTWDRTNWLMTTYAPTAPFIVADPQNQTNTVGQMAVFSVAGGGSALLNYQWYFNTNSSISGATNSTLALSNLQNADAGAYFVVITNSAGSVTSQVATLTVGVSGTTFQLWQQTNFTSDQLSDTNISGPAAIPAGDHVPNFVKYALGLPPFVAVTNSLVGFQMENGEGVLSYVRPANVSDVTYQVEVSTDLVNWTTNGITLQLVSTADNGMQTWRAYFTGAASVQRYFRLVFGQ